MCLRDPSRGQQFSVERGDEGVGTFEGVIVSKDRADLNIEIRIMLRQRPDRENQVIGVNPGDFSLIHPAGQDRGLFVDQSFEIRRQSLMNARRALDKLIGEQTAFARQVAAHLKLAPDVGQYLLQWITVFVQRVKRGQPDFEQAEQKGGVNRLFRWEVVEQVRFAEPCLGGNLIYRCAAKSMG